MCKNFKLPNVLKAKSAKNLKVSKTNKQRNKQQITTTTKYQN